MPLEKASHSLCRQGHLGSLGAPKVLARGFKGQSYQDQSSGIETSDMVQAIEKAAAPFALKLFFPLPLYGFAVFSLGVLNYLSFFCWVFLFL